MNETQIQRQILDWLVIQEKQGKLWYTRLQNNAIRNGHPVKNKHSKTGLADIMILIQGVILFMEVKSKRGKQTDNQKDFQQAVKKHGKQIYVIVRSLEEAIREVENAKYRSIY